MAAIVKNTVGFLLNRGRDLIAERLRDGDVTEQHIRELILRELSSLKSKIDGLARKDLLASLTFMEEGILSLGQLLDQEKAKDDEISRDAKEHFKQAKIRAIDAFNNEALKPSDRLNAMKIRILATVMEKFDCPANALGSCRLCLEQLHNMRVVQKCFSAEITKSVKSWFYKNERRKLIADVCKMNYEVHRFTRKVKGDLCCQIELPFITTDQQEINPLRDFRLYAALKEFEVVHYMLEWTFGCEGQWPSHKLIFPFSITTNTKGQFIVEDSKNIKVFHPSGKFFKTLCSERLELKTGELATDKDDSLYLCINRITESPEICVFDKHHDLHHTFPLRAGVSEAKSFTIRNKDQVFVVVRYNNGVLQVDVYENDGRFVRSFGEDVLSQTRRSLHSITTCDDGVMILDGNTKCVHVFSAEGTHLNNFDLNECDEYCGGIVFFEPSQRVLILSKNKNDNRGQLSIYTKGGELVRSVQLDTREEQLCGITVTVEGQVAVTSFDYNKVHVLQL